MKTLTINIKSERVLSKVKWILERFKDDGVEIVSEEDLNDLKLIKATRVEESDSFEEYLTNTKNSDKKKCN